MSRKPLDLIDPSEAIPVLIDLQRHRLFCIKMQSVLERKIDSRIVSIMNFSPDYQGLSLDAQHKIAAKIRAQIEKDGMDGLPMATGLFASSLAMSVPMFRDVAAARAPFDNHRADVEKRQKQVIQRLAVWPWLKSGKHERLTLGQGFAEKGAAIILGEAGSPSGYDTVSRFWKRLNVGLADDGGIQRKKSGMNQEQAMRMGYKPQRRAEMWMLADSMYKHQVTHAEDCPCLACAKKAQKARADEDQKENDALRGPVPPLASTEADDLPDGSTRPVYRAKNPYGLVYIEEYNKFRDAGKIHGHAFNHGRRVMWKEVLLDFWSAWRAATRRLTSEARMPPVILIPELSDASD